MADLLDPARTIVREVFGAYDTMPFDLRLEDFTDHAPTMFRACLSRIESARTMKPAEIASGDID